MVAHEPLKPSCPGHGLVMKIGDFGMSRQVSSRLSPLAADSLERTLTPGVIGTAAYCAPEVRLAAVPFTVSRGWHSLQLFRCSSELVKSPTASLDSL